MKIENELKGFRFSVQDNGIGIAPEKIKEDQKPDIIQKA